MLQVLSGALWAGVPLLVAFASFAVAARTGQVLTSDIIFPAIALFMLLQFPLAMVRVCRLLFAPCKTFSDAVHSSA